MGTKLQNFGYAQINYINEDLKINCHEFHKSFVELMEKTVYNVDKIGYNFEKKQWTCGYIKNNTLAAYGHVHFFGNLEFIKRRMPIVNN
jgi:cobyrinic acid a,c-diamide synthase